MLKPSHQPLVYLYNWYRLVNDLNSGISLPIHITDTMLHNKAHQIE